MDLQSVFIGRVFNKETKSVGDNSPHSNSCELWRGKDWEYKNGCWIYTPKKEIVPFVGGRTIKETNEYNALTEYYENLEKHEDVDYTKYEDVDDSENWITRHLREYNKRKKDKSSQMKLYDDYYNSDVLTVEDEIIIMGTYCKNEIYVDIRENQLTIVDINDNYAEVIVNAYLGKLRNDSIKLNRVDFLTRMGFKPGILTQTV